MELKQYIQKKSDKSFKIRLKEMKNFFSDKKAVKKRLKQNPLIYGVFVKKVKDIEYGLTVIESGKIGKEHFMTRGHYHLKNYPEIYILIKGNGVLLLQNKLCKAINLQENKPLYVEPEHAHRVINIGKTKLEFLSIYSSKAGHNYKKIEKKGFKKKF